jgi:paraquat-inducible protein A
MNAEDDPLICPVCGQPHQRVHLKAGQKAECLRCDTLLARGRWLGPEAPLVFAVTGLVLAVPACLLPFITAGKLGDQRVSLVFTGVGALWDNGMRALSMLVLFMGGIVPIGLLVTLVLLLAPPPPRRSVLDPRELARVAAFLERWAIPEVQVLAILVALLKLGSLVDVELGAGFWCYCAMTLSLIFALRGVEKQKLPDGQDILIPEHPK